MILFLLFVEELKEKLKESILEPLEIDLFRSDKSIFPALISAKTIKKIINNL